MDWNEIFKYENGKLIRLDSNNQHKHVGWINSCGYIQFEYLGKNYMLACTIWEMFNGPIPEGYLVDHKDRNPLNNKIENLRLATKSQNQINKKLPKTNTTGFKGVFITPNGKYQARLGHNGIQLYLGLFDTAKEANECVIINRKKLYGEFADS